MPVERLRRIGAIAPHLLPAAADVETMAPSQVRDQPLRFADDIGCLNDVACCCARRCGLR